MPCPYCGGTKLEGNHCAFCGAVLLQEDVISPKKLVLREQHRVFMEKMLEGDAWRRYRALHDSYLQLEASALKIHRSNDCEYTIPYEQLIAIQYRKKCGLFNGWLSMRGEKNRNQPLPDTYFLAKKDDFTLLYSPEDEQNYYQIFNVLQVIVESNQRVETL